MEIDYSNIEAQQRDYNKFFYDGDILKLKAIDDKWCVIISKDWFDKWKMYIYRNESENNNFVNGEDIVDAPGPLDLSSITDNGKLKEGLTLRNDVMCIPKTLFQKLVAIYGFAGDRNFIPYRKIFITDDFERSFDLYPPVLHLRPRGAHEILQLICDSKETIGFVKSFIRIKNNLKSDVDIHLFDSKNGDKLPDDEKATLKECSLDGEKEITYAIVSKSFMNGDGPSGFQFYKNFNPSYPHGACGLNNLGNTCFMNSAIQCISSVAPLRDYVLNDHFEDQINSENKLGSGGNIARAFAHLMSEMWSESKRGGSCVPRELKLQIAKIAPQFAGYQQHDAQELMNFLLDFLHEDLNKIKQKPYIEVKDADGRPEKVVAEESWSNFKKRNDSIIVDLFYGLLKSTVICPECNLVSVTFDPFNSLSLPLVNHCMDVVVWPDGIYRLPVVPSCRAKDILASLQRNLPIQAEREYVVTIAGSKRLKVVSLTSEESLRRENVFVFNLAKSSFLEILLHVDGHADIPPFLLSLPSNQKRFTKKEIILAVKTELASVCSKYGEAFESFANAEELDFSPDIALFDLDTSNYVSIGLPQSLEVELSKTVNRCHVRLADCIDLFLASEQLGNHDLWYCNRCKQHRQAFKKFDIWSLPQVLVVHLKRYRNVYRMHKNETFVDYPIDDLKMTCAKGTNVYELVAVSNHLGFFGGGHYTAYTKIEKMWYNFNDSSVSRLSGPVVTGDAYILVYMLKTSTVYDPEVTVNGHCPSLEL